MSRTKSFTAEYAENAEEPHVFSANSAYSAEKVLVLLLKARDETIGK